MMQDFHDLDVDYDSDYDSDCCSKKRKLSVPTPVQLAPKHCNCVKCEWRGHEKPCEQKYITFADMREYYEKQARVTASGVKAETLDAISKIQTFYLAAIKEKDDQVKQLILEHQEIVNTFSNESLLTQERLDKEKALKKKFGLCKTGSFKKKAKALKLLKSRQDVFLKDKLKVHEDVKTTLQVHDLCNSEWTEVKKKNKPRVQNDVDPVGTGKVCEQSNNCQNWDELVVSDCIFDSECKDVIRQSDKIYTVVEGKYQTETKESVCARKSPKVNIMTPKQVRSILKESVKNVWERTDTSSQVMEDTNEEEVVIRVQKELAVQAIELMVKAGKNKIKVELI